MRALMAGRQREAMAQFEAAIELERRLSKDRPQARYLSYYGLCLAADGGQLHEALQFCREAVTLESFNPDVRCNLGRVLMLVGRRKEAYRNFKRGLDLEGGHRGLRAAVKKMGIRSRPVLGFLGRSHPMNVLLGRMRIAVQTR